VANLQRQSGISILGLIISLVIVIFIALLAFKLIPPFIEFRTQKTAIQAIAREKQSASVVDIRRAWETRGAIDDFALKASDLEITKQGNQVVISFAYRKEVPLFANVGVYIDFAANSSE
jgi:hypothetical protein